MATTMITQTIEVSIQILPQDKLNLDGWIMDFACHQTTSKHSTFTDQGKLSLSRPFF